MRFFVRLTLFLVALTVSAPIFAAEDPVIQAERATVGFTIFKNVCFMMSPKESWAKRTAFLDSKFPRHDGDKKAAFLNMTPSKQGEVWAAVFPKGVFAIIVETNGNCHVIAKQADAATLHKESQKLSEEAQKFLSNAVVQFRPPSDSGVGQSSGFDIKATADGPTLTVVVVSTYNNPPPNKFAAFMTVAVSADNQK